MNDRRNEAGALIARVETLLFAADPVGINFETNDDEYHPEAVSILARRSEIDSIDSLQRVVHEEFVRWFDEDTAGPIERYRLVSEQIWQEWASDRIGPAKSDAD